MSYGPRPFMEPSGTKVRNTQTDKSQYTTYVIQALIFAIAGDAVILLMSLFVLAVGWIGLFVGAAIAVFVLSKKGARAIATVYTSLGNGYAEVNAVKRLRWGIVIATVGTFAFFAAGWWEWLIARDEMLLLILETITPLLNPFSLPPLYTYLSLIGLWFFAALKKKGIITFGGILGILITWTVTSIKYTVNFAIIWSRVRYVGATMLAPPAAAGIILCYAMFKEMVAPNLNFILDPIEWSQFVQSGGLIGLIFPRYVEWKRQLADRHVRVAVEDENGNDKRIDFLDTPEMHNFARAVLKGAEFTEDTAHHWLGYGRKRWEKFRNEFLSRGWAAWKNEDHHQDGILLLGGGRTALAGCLPHSEADVD